MKASVKVKTLLAVLLFPLCASAQVSITDAQGWLESAYVKFSPYGGATDYNVYVKGGQYADYTQLDDELVRQYPDGLRADAVGLKAGSYQFKVVPVSGGAEVAEGAAESATVSVKAHDRSGFAHVGMADGIGAYKNDGTLKDGAKVIYVWADNAKTVTHDVVTNNKGGVTTGTGLQDIVYLYQKGYETTPLAIRIIGTIKAGDMDRFDSSAEGLQVKGKNAFANIPITIEGIGSDAAISGFGILCRNASNVEFRNFAIMLCMDDCLSLDTKNSHIWIHNMDFFYGNTGGDADQAKGDGTVDIKGQSTHITVSYNHFIDCGKTSLGGMKSETTDCWMTFHHNWFDHSDSRHPRVRTAFYHVYNNYFDGVSKYGVGVTSGGSSLVENNYFRNTKYPMLISKQGTDAEGSGTFSGEPGGVIKAFNNVIENPRKIQYWSSDVQASGAWDAVLAKTRDEAVSATALTGGTAYNSAADEAARTTYMENNIDDPAQVKDIVKGEYGAGRMQHGDFKWSFNNSLQDENYGVISELKSALQTYQSTLIGFADGTPVSNGGATKTVDDGDGKGISEEANDSYVPSWGSGGGGGSTITAGKYVIGSSSQYFWFNASNEEKYQAYVADGTFKTDGTFKPDFEVKKSDGTSCSDYIGSIRLAKDQSLTVYYADGICSANFYVSGSGSQNWALATSADGTNWDAAGTVDGKSGAHPACNITPKEPVKYVRITNTNSSNRDVQGVKIATPDPDANEDEDPADDDDDLLSSDASAEFTLNGEEIAVSGTTYTLNVAYDADDADGYTVVVTPADNATVAAVTGATGENGTYVIAAPEAGKTATATFRILAENQANARTYTFNIVKAADPSEKPDEPAPAPTEGVITCSFDLNGKTLVVNESAENFFTISGNGSNSKGEVTVDGTTYKNCLKLESATSIKFTTTAKMKLTLYFGASETASIKINGQKITGSGNTYSQELEAGAYELTKDKSVNLFYIKLEPVEEPAAETDPCDVDGNKVVDMADVLAIANFIAGTASEEITAEAADANKDGQVNIADIIFVLAKIQK